MGSRFIQREILTDRLSLAKAAGRKKVKRERSVGRQDFIPRGKALAHTHPTPPNKHTCQVTFQALQGLKKPLRESGRIGVLKRSFAWILETSPM